LPQIKAYCEFPADDLLCKTEEEKEGLSAALIS
jgi:hypothetical protein